MFNCKTSDDTTHLTPIETEFSETAHAFGLSLTRNAGSGEFVSHVTQQAYKNWKKNTPSE